MPTIKPDPGRVALLKALEICVLTWSCNPGLSQDFYGEQLQGDFRADRFWELAKKDGVPRGKFEKFMQENKVHPANCFVEHCCFFPPRQVPCVFSFIDVHEKKGLNEDTVHLTCWYTPWSVSRLPWSPLCQMQTKRNINFLTSWLPTFALNPPTAKECQARVLLFALTPACKTPLSCDRKLWFRSPLTAAW